MSHPPRFTEDDPLLARVRGIALALPGAAEKVSHGRPTFFTRKVFAIFGGVVKGDHGSWALGQALVFLPDPEERPALLDDGEVRRPRVRGSPTAGWHSTCAGRCDWSEVAEPWVESSVRG